jgi:hypothetical protein
MSGIIGVSPDMRSGVVGAFPDGHVVGFDSHLITNSYISMPKNTTTPTGIEINSYVPKSGSNLLIFSLSCQSATQNGTGHVQLHKNTTYITDSAQSFVYPRNDNLFFQWVHSAGDTTSRNYQIYVVETANAYPIVLSYYQEVYFTIMEIKQ